MNTDKIKRYRLLKDIETIDLSAKAGEIGVHNNSDKHYADKNKVWFDNNRYFFYISQIENNLGVWFEEVQQVSEPVKEGDFKVVEFYLHHKHDSIIDSKQRHEYKIVTLKGIPNGKLPVIKQAIESALNNNEVLVNLKYKEHYDRLLILHKKLYNDYADLVEKSIGEVELTDEENFKNSWVGKQHGIKMEEMNSLVNKIYCEKPNDDNAFVWTDELVKEFVITYNNVANLIRGVDPIGQSIKEFKQTKPSQPSSELKEGKDWEIVSLIGKNDWVIYKSAYTFPECFQTLVDSNEFPIHSVRRLSDNTVFSVGDKVNGVGEVLTIEKFEIEYAFGNMMKVCFNQGGFYPIKSCPTPTQPVVEDKPPKRELMYNTLSIPIIHYKNDLCDIMGCVKYDEKIHK